MSTEIEKLYDPQKVEERWYRFWQENKLFSSKPEHGKTPFVIVIPPPNVTGSLHMGHALNNTLQDIIIRFRRMQNYNTLWVPGTDHGGIATQNVVEKLLKAEGKTRQDLGREKFLERMWQWRKESGGTILKQLERLGSSLDWDRTRFTMDEVCSRAVTKAFVELFNRGLIYRGNRLVNWCPRCHTALSDIEVEHEEEIGKLWHMQYPLKPGESKAKGKAGAKKKKAECIVVATTRPETMLGDTAVAVHPDDKRYKKFIGRKVLLPLTGREIPVIADEAVDKTFGTGAVKVTPAHDPTDFEIGARHHLPHVVVIDFHGRMTKEAGKFEGLDRYEARKQVLHALEEQGLLLETAEHPHAVGRCYRCASAVEPLTSEQWFLKVGDMSRRAMKVVEEGKIEFYPESWKKPYLLWLENLRDWCISRQIWWGHRIPVYYCKKGSGGETQEPPCPPIASVEKPGKCPHCGNAVLEQDPDVLDTWFSSALWPFSVFGWPQESEDLRYYYPTSVLVTGHEILYLWVARMVQMGLEFMNDIPFHHVFIHGIVRDKSGKKMSKSLGNVIDPLMIMEKYGTDALRFALTQAAAPGRDMQLSDDSFVGARNFANKIWNASRFVMMNAQNVAWGEDFIMAVWPMEMADKWILSEYRIAVREATRALERYDMDQAARIIYDFFWSRYCDWYIEMAKIRISGTDEQARKVVLSVLMEVLSGSLRMLHPVMPFITEEIWQSQKNYLRHAAHSKSIMNAPWPEIDESKIDEPVRGQMKLIQDVVTALRTVRSEMNVPPGKNINVIMNFTPQARKDVIEKNLHYIRALAKLETVETGETLARPPQSAAAVASGIEIFVPLAGLIDLEKEKQRLRKEIAGALAEQERCQNKTANEEFVKRAPQKEVDKVRERLKEAQLKAERFKENLKAIE
ncbi:MAG: valine--tRNA ligase [Endomicrobiales bacterium]